METKLLLNHQKLITAGLLITIGVFGRILLHDVFNSVINPIVTTGFQAPLDVFFITAAISIFSGILLGRYYILVIPVSVIAITDIYYSIVNPTYASYWTAYLFLFTWTGYGIIALLGNYFSRKSPLDKTLIPKILGASILGIVCYDLWTNFGFWLGFSKLGFYPQTLDGLFTVYYGGLPTMLWHLLSASLAITATTALLIYLKDIELIKKQPIIQPKERYLIISATVFLMVLSILTALI